MEASVTTRAEGGRLLLCPSGRWEIGNAAELDRILRELPPPNGPVSIELDGIEALDTAGAWLLVRTRRLLRGRGLVADFVGGRPAFQAMLGQLEAAGAGPETVPPPERAPPLVGWLIRIGAASAALGTGIIGFVIFLGEVMVTLFKTLMRPRLFRVTPIFAHVEAAGVSALPIIGLVSFLIGVVLAYQAEVQLRSYGATPLVVDITAIAIMREFGVLLTAIMVAGRSGSAFTAQIGTMIVGEEVDALRALGLDPIEILVLPRVIALMIALPLLAFFADMLGLLGSGLLCWTVIGLNPTLFAERLGAISVTHFWIGLVKAPVFAFVIALVGCYEGLRVSGSAESVGRQTTRSVVEAVFLVIVLDALFSVFFDVVGV